jgi:hypothetical protein
VFVLRFSVVDLVSIALAYLRRRRVLARTVRCEPCTIEERLSHLNRPLLAEPGQLGPKLRLRVFESGGDLSKRVLHHVEKSSRLHFSPCLSVFLKLDIPHDPWPLDRHPVSTVR